MVVNMYKHMGKVVTKILQGSVVTLTTLGGLTTHPPVANFLQCIGWAKKVSQIIFAITLSTASQFP